MSRQLTDELSGKGKSMERHGSESLRAFTLSPRAAYRLN